MKITTVLGVVSAIPTHSMAQSSATNAASRVAAIVEVQQTLALFPILIDSHRAYFLLRLKLVSSSS
jgi:hypothetical protein